MYTMVSNKIRYTSVKVPTSLADRINEIASDGGYRSVSEFVLHWTRHGLQTEKN